jgi:hypothetical protein
VITRLMFTCESINMPVDRWLGSNISRKMASRHDFLHYSFI